MCILTPLAALNITDLMRPSKLKSAKHISIVLATLTHLSLKEELNNASPHINPQNHEKETQNTGKARDSKNATKLKLNKQLSFPQRDD